MIRFACPHCGKLHTVDDRLSGRDGWCALCMGLLAVPATDVPTPAEQLEHLRKLLKAAEDRFKKTNPSDLALEEAQNSTESEPGLRVLQARAEELHRANEVLASELSLAVQTAGAVEARIEELSRELERLSRDLEQERALRREAEERALENGTEARNVDVQLAETDNPLVTLIPELVDVPEANDLMMKTLLRFIEPE